MKNKTLILLVVTFLLGLYLRFYSISTNFIFGADQSEDMYKLVQIYNLFKENRLVELPIIGENGTFLIGNDKPQDGNPVYSGVFFLYLLLPFAAFSGFDPARLVAVFAFTNAVSIIVLYLAASKIFDKLTGIVSALLFAASYYMNVYSRAIWTPSLIPFFVVTSLYLLVTVVKDKKLYIWPILLFVVSGMSQLHDSGYYYMIFFLILTAFLKPQIPKSFTARFVAVFAFFAPLIPSIYYEFVSGFKLIPAVNQALVYQTGLLGDSNLILLMVRKLWEFGVSTYFPLYFNHYYVNYLGVWYTPVLIVVTLVLLYSFVLVLFHKDKLARYLFRIFVLTFFAVPLFAKIYYSDNYFGLYPLFGTTFSTVGAMPFVFLALGYSISRSLTSNLKVKVLAAIFLVCIICLNVGFVNISIFENGEEKYDYGDKLKIIQTIKQDVDDKMYKAAFLDPVSYAGGIEFLYLFYLQGMPSPVTFNGKDYIKTAFIEYDLTDAPVDSGYIIVGRPLWRDYTAPQYTLLGESGRFRVYGDKSI